MCESSLSNGVHRLKLLGLQKICEFLHHLRYFALAGWCEISDKNRFSPIFAGIVRINRQNSTMKVKDMRFSYREFLKRLKFSEIFLSFIKILKLLEYQTYISLGPVSGCLVENSHLHSKKIVAKAYRGAF